MIETISEWGVMNRNESADYRRRRIVDLLTVGTGSVSTEELSADLGVSIITVRRDLERLDRAGLVTRTHGGAVIGSLRAEKSIRERRDTNALAKADIAASAARLVPPGSTVMLDAGTTTGRIATELLTVPGLTIVTTGINALAVLAESNTDATVISAGGTLRRVNQALLGPFAETVIRSVYADVAFVGSDCVDVERGVSSRTPEQNALKALMIAQSRRPVIVADATKLGATWATHWFLPSTPVELLTDRAANDDILQAFDASEAWSVLIAEDGGTSRTTTDTTLGGTA
jgi:DeoR family fructose operon transcriptional repressor